MSAEQNKELVRRFYQAFEANDLDTLKEILSPDMVANMLGVHGTQNREEMLQGISMWNATFDDIHIEIIDQIAEENKVVTRLVFHTSHTKTEFQGVAPTGKSCASQGVTVERIQNGRIIERYSYGDRSSMFEQLGLVPAAQAAE